jgi:hypothetical protein
VTWFYHWRDRLITKNPERRKRLHKAAREHEASNDLKDFERAFKNAALLM